MNSNPEIEGPLLQRGHKDWYGLNPLRPLNRSEFHMDFIKKSQRLIWISQSSLSLSFSLHWMHFASLKFFEPLILNSASARQILCTFHFLWEYCPLEIWKLLTSAVSPSDQVREATSRRKEYCEECKSFILLNRQRLMVRALKEESARPWSGEQVWGFYELVSLFLNLTSPPAITKK